MKNLKTGVIIALGFIGVATLLVLQRSSQLRLHEENEELQQHVAKLQTDNASLSNQVARAARTPALSGDRLRELLRLRGEVGTLRRQQRELEEVVAAQRTAPGSSSQPTREANSSAHSPPPFQLQLVLDELAEDSEVLTNDARSTAGESLRVQKTPLMDSTAIQAAAVTRDAASGALQIEVEFSEVGKELFAAITRENLNRQLAVVLDGRLYAAPVIRGEISQGKAQITGNFTDEEASALAAKLNEAINRP